MAKKESNLKNMLVALTMITLIASAALGGIYELTKEPIAAAKLEKKNNAIRQVIPDFDNNPTEEVYKHAADGDTLYFYPGKSGGNIVGTAVETFTNKGFSGEIKVMVGFLPDGTINDVVVLEHAETPGLGDKMEKSKSDWTVQFQGKDPESFRLMVTKDGGDVDAITASTISSRAFCDAVARAYETFKSTDK
ncbi:MAG: RnfABCDGE type electron transport complex subunit G [Bacteroidales bacterium]|nr:RnfABCDGE type electron transport complex subunit G [Bacteroidales bacterium]HKL66822.1 RnfABCDGE type electron transport complex subunit G [Bacteroidales bacterium]